jgi:MFS family permease
MKQATRPPAIPPSKPAHDPFAAVRIPAVQRFLCGNVLSLIGTQMQGMAVLWEIYERSGSAMDLAWVGLVQVIPIVALALVSGHVADRFDRKKVIMAALAVTIVASFGLTWISATAGPILWIYGWLLVNAIARAFLQTAKQSFLPQIVPREHFSNAVTWSMGGFHLASMVGPAIGGLLIAWQHSAALVYVLAAVGNMVFMNLLIFVPHRKAAAAPQQVTFRTLVAGFHFVWSNQIILGAIALDMFAVLLGGAVTLLPIYAKDILHTGPSGLGWMRTAEAIGALSMALFLAFRPPMHNAGRALLWAVAGFGGATIVFGLSTNYWLSLAMLFLIGALDNISVVIRHTLVQVLTPDEMRGRVSAVNGVFINVSNELGGFESGLVARLVTPVFSVVSGGIGTLLVVATAAASLPKLRQYGRLDGKPHDA